VADVLDEPVRLVDGVDRVERVAHFGVDSGEVREYLVALLGGEAVDCVEETLQRVTADRCDRCERQEAIDDRGLVRSVQRPVRKRLRCLRVSSVDRGLRVSDLGGSRAAVPAMRLRSHDRRDQWRRRVRDVR
jgi:hypothetical protein